MRPALDIWKTFFTFYPKKSFPAQDIINNITITWALTGVAEDGQDSDCAAEQRLMQHCYLTLAQQRETDEIIQKIYLILEWKWAQKPRDFVKLVQKAVSDLDNEGSCFSAIPTD